MASVAQRGTLHENQLRHPTLARLVGGLRPARRNAPVRQRFYQFTAIDENTRFRVLHVYDHNHTKTATEFLQDVREQYTFLTRQ